MLFWGLNSFLPDEITYQTGHHSRALGPESAIATDKIISTDDRGGTTETATTTAQKN